MDKNTVNLWKNYNMATNLMLDAMGGTSNIVGEFAERLVAEFYGGTKLVASSKAADVVLKDGTAIQVKARMPRQTLTTSLGVIRSWDFDYLVAVLFATDGTVIKAVELSAESAKNIATANKWQNGCVITTTKDFLEHDSARDITDGLNALMGISAPIVPAVAVKPTCSQDVFTQHDYTQPLTDKVNIDGRNTETHRRESESFQDFVKRTLKNLLENSLIPQEELKLLQTKEYSKTTFGLEYALLETNSTKTKDGCGHRRYYSKVFAGRYYVCKEWWKHKMEIYEPRFAKWLKHVAELNELSGKGQ